MPDQWKTGGLLDRAGDALFPRELMNRLTADEGRKRVFVLFAMILAVPAFVYFTAHHFFVPGRPIEIVPDFAGLVTILLSIPILRRVANCGPIYRLNAAVLLVLMIINIHNGGYDGADLLWLYAFPLVVLFVLGRVEGMVWTLALIAPCAAIILWPGITGGFPYSPDFTIRFFVSFAIVTMLSFLFESLRRHYSTLLEKRQVELEDALRNVKTLTGLLPICGGCKKIRNDEGYWQAVDVYITTHTGARFTHGLCESCLKAQYPELHEKLQKEGKLGGTDGKNARI